MHQFDVVANANPETRHRVPYLLVLQSDLFDQLATRVVAPLMPLRSYRDVMDHLNPVISIGEESFVLSIAELAGVPVVALGTKVASIENQRFEIIAALDFLITGN